MSSHASGKRWYSKRSVKWYATFLTHHILIQSCYITEYVAVIFVCEADMFDGVMPRLYSVEW